MANVYIYNPTCEMAVRNGSPHYRPPVILQAFERDMAEIMMFLASADDYVVGYDPDIEFTRLWTGAGMRMPHFCTEDEATVLIDLGHTLAPWGQSLHVYQRFGCPEVSPIFDIWTRLLYSRRTSVHVVEALRADYLPSFIEEPLPEIITEQPRLDEVISDGMCTLKSLWSASGRGVQLVRKEEHKQQAQTWAKAQLERDGAIVCEPFLNKLVEMTFMFRIDPDGSVKYLGKNYYESDESGRFGSELIGVDLMQQYVDAGQIPANWEEVATQLLTKALSNKEIMDDYTGHLGIDAMLFNSNGTPKLRCCVEANLRYTMGNINTVVATCFAPGTTARWDIVRMESDGEWDAHCSQMEEKHPLVVDENGKIKSGFFRLTGKGENKRFGMCGVAACN